MASGKIVGQIDTEKLLNVPLYPPRRPARAGDAEPLVPAEDLGAIVWLVVN